MSLSGKDPQPHPVAVPLVECGRTIRQQTCLISKSNCTLEGGEGRAENAGMWSGGGGELQFSVGCPGQTSLRRGRERKARS